VAGSKTFREYVIILLEASWIRLGFKTANKLVPNMERKGLKQPQPRRSNERR
jgi:hypothetical protein